VVQCDSEGTGSLNKTHPIQLRPKTERGVSETGAHNAEALALLHEWLANESGYDEQAWPEVKESLEAHRLGNRRLFSG